MGERAIGVERPAKWIVRAEPYCNLKLLDRLVKPPYVGVGIPKSAICNGQRRIEFYCLLKRVDRLVILAPCQVNAAQSKEPVRILIVQLDGPLRRIPGIVHPRIIRRGVEIYLSLIHISEPTRLGMI